MPYMHVSILHILQTVQRKKPDIYPLLLFLISLSPLLYYIALVWLNCVSPFPHSNEYPIWKENEKERKEGESLYVHAHPVLNMRRKFIVWTIFVMMGVNSQRSVSTLLPEKARPEKKNSSEEVL